MSNLRVLSIPVSVIITFFLLQVETSCAGSIDDLILAIWGFDIKKAGELVDGGVNVNSKDAKGTYPLILACSYKDNDEMIELLLSKGADPNIRGPNGETPLALAARYTLTAVKMLVEKGADINSKDKAGYTPLWWATKMERSEIIEFLKRKGAKE